MSVKYEATVCCLHKFLFCSHCFGLFFFILTLYFFVECFKASHVNFTEPELKVPSEEAVWIIKLNETKKKKLIVLHFLVPMLLAHKCGKYQVER